MNVTLHSCSFSFLGSAAACWQHAWLRSIWYSQLGALVVRAATKPQNSSVTATTVRPQRSFRTPR
uniref:Secreted protein n=1 Tax=Meleagris gallopavo TaxID=9103 RepID=A0A803XR84_MELGA